MPNIFKALITVIHKVPDMKASIGEYKRVLGVNPNFQEDFYTGFTVAGGFELGLMPLPKECSNTDRVIAYWEVGPHIESVFKYLIKNGAGEIGAVRDVGQNIKVAELRDPFGNPIGIINNPNFIENYKKNKFLKDKPGSFSQCFAGLETVTLHVDSPKEVAGWYSKVLKQKPITNDPSSYIGYTINGFHFGIMPKREGKKYNNLVTAYWQLPGTDLSQKQAELIKNSHKIVGAVKSVGPKASLTELEDKSGIVYGVVKDPDFAFDLTQLVPYKAKLRSAVIPKKRQASKELDQEMTNSRSIKKIKS